MSLILSGSDGLSDVDGSASTPAIRGTDANTGIFFPAADTAAISTGGSERMRIDSSGNVGIGTSSPVSNLDVSAASDTGFGLRNSSSVTSGNRGTINWLNSSVSTVAYIRATAVTDNVGTDLSFATRPAAGSLTERMRITSGGEVYIAGTTDQGAYNLQCNGTGVWGAGAYVNGSDARIKEDVAPIDSGLDVVEKLSPVTYRYKEDWSKDQSVQTGFIAQELLTALDGKNYVDGIVQQGGSEGYYSVAYQNIIPILTKAIQELSAKNAALEARIAVLEAK